MVIHRRTGCTAQIALRPLAAVLSCLALIAAGCSNDSGLKSGDAATFVEGFAGEMSLAGDDWKPADDGAAVPDGARVRATDSEVRLALRDGTARLAPGAAATVTAQAVQLERGDLLLDTDGGLEAAVGDTRIVAGGIVRVSSGVSAHVGVYEGNATVRRPAQEREVAALRQMDLVEFRLAPSGQPLRYGAEDPWDQELLGAAIAFDGEVARLARGMEIEFGTRPKPRAFYREFARRRVLPVLAKAAPVSRGRVFGPPSDVLLTMFVAQTVEQGPVTDTIRHVAQLRSAGARWGLIAVELDVASDALVAAVDGLDSDRLALAERAPNSALGSAVVTGASAAGADADGRGRQAASAGDTGTATSSSTASTSGGSSGGGGGGEDGGGGRGDGGKGGGNDGDGDGDGDDDEEEQGPVDEVVSDVVTTVEESRPGDDDPDDPDDPDDDSPLRKALKGLEIRLP